MPTPPDTERRLNRLDNDVSAIYEILGSVQATQDAHGERLKAMSLQLNALRGTQLQHGSRLTQIEAHLGDVDNRLNGIDGRLDGIDNRLDKMSGSLGQILALLEAS